MSSLEKDPDFIAYIQKVQAERDPFRFGMMDEGGAWIYLREFTLERARRLEAAWKRSCPQRTFSLVEHWDGTAWRPVQEGGHGQ